ncbi:GntR family transcriptional regulator [Falsiroseomonas sp. HW251]|uniref:GntR family transcriptional regulator n=1 Tax=Falsiroseomonas sp. HW251 TaxID=3390998 RepID=UPI003D322C5B
MTAEDAVTAQLRRLILNGTLPPGAKLTVSALCARMGVSPTPLRAALRLLEGEGLVESQANRGAWVRALAPADIRNLYRLRGAVLGLLIPDVARHASNADLDELELLEHRYEAAVAAGQGAAAMQANHAFQRALLALARNPDAAAVMERTWGLVEALRLRLGFGPGRLARAVMSHHALLDALRRRDADTATAAALEASRGAMQDLLELAEARERRVA